MNHTPSESIRFYFSFRSPYAWIAAERLDAVLGDLDVAIESIPIFPTADLFPNDPTLNHRKLAYILQDIPRLARECGLTVRFPSSSDTDWAFAHAAYLGAESRGRGKQFMLELFRKRFCEGLNVGDERVVAEAASRAAIQPDAIVAAGHSEVLRAKAAGGWQLAIDRDQIFGVPTFAYAGRLYWGQDRMHFLRSAVVRKNKVE